MISQAHLKKPRRPTDHPLAARTPFPLPMVTAFFDALDFREAAVRAQETAVYAPLYLSHRFHEKPRRSCLRRGLIFIASGQT